MNKQEIAQWAQEVDWTLCDSAIARMFNMKSQTVRLRRMKLGIPIGKGGKKTGDALRNVLTKVKSDPETWDWTQRDVDLAKEHGVCRERVRQFRRSLGKPNAIFHGMTKRVIAINLVMDKLDTKKSISHNAKALGVSLPTLRRRSKQIGAHFVHGLSKYDWDAVDWSKRNCDIAMELGCHEVGVATRRKKHAPHTVRPIFDWSSVDWSKSNKEIAKETGKSAQYVANRRQKHQQRP